MVNTTPNSRMSTPSSSSSVTNTNTSLYPYPANLNISNFVSLDLNSSNYVLWRAEMRNLIESQDLGGFISSETPAPLPLIPSLGTLATTGIILIALFMFGSLANFQKKLLAWLLISTCLERFG